MTAQPAIDAAALTAAERGILAASAHDASPWVHSLLVDLETVASLAAERAAAGQRLTLLDLARQLAAWAAEPTAGAHG